MTLNHILRWIEGVSLLEIKMEFNELVEGMSWEWKEMNERRLGHKSGARLGLTNKHVT